MALQTDGYNADTEEMSVGNSPEYDSDEESGLEKDPESAAVVLERLDLNGGPPFSARQYASGSEFSLTLTDSASGGDASDDDYASAQKKKKKKRKIARRVPCDECRRLFGSQKSLQKHKAVHLGTFTCRVCQKRCASSGSLKLHSRIHSNDKPHACDLCDAAFVFHLQLQNHKLKAHEGGVMPYSCQECDRAFAQENHLESHMRSHQQRRCECDFCGAGFKDGSGLRSHIQRVHSVRKKQDEDTDARRSGRTARIDYNDEVINVEVAKEYKRKKHAVKSFDRAPKVASRLRQREDEEPTTKKSGKRGKPGKLTKRVDYRATGAKPSRTSARATSAVNYGDEDSGEPSSEEEEEEEKKVVSKPKNVGRGRRRPSSGKNSPKKSQENSEEEEEEEKKEEEEEKKEEEEGKEEEEKEEEEEEEVKKITPKPHPRSAARGRGKSIREKITEETSVVESPPQRGRGRSKKSALVENGYDEEEEVETERVETPRRGGRRSAAPTPRTASARKAGGPTKSVTIQESGGSNEDEDQPTLSAGRRGRGRAAPAAPERRSADPAASESEPETSDEEQVSTPVNRRATPRTAGGRGDSSVAPSTPQRGRRASAQKKLRYTDDVDSGVDEAELETTEARRAPVKRGRSARGSAGSDEEEESEVAARGRRGKKDESTMPPKKRLRGRQ